jgi:hypothetical protein
VNVYGLLLSVDVNGSSEKGRRNEWMKVVFMEFGY